ncbi:Rid family hydrolase [Mycobacterium shimoidei]|uniref:Endoribonuclease L-PSP [Conexibacter woesei DSM] n=1 Tax=Mycobacterium shimoidei TaxID=29313 RepID=A0A1E3T3D4_MYCSH|nr:Rid family hydrolase [Mycobacterium shimoidei]MCV7260785.1 enamine deaminase RidA [Mycobacterium shimoidei]ODR08373.1 enamine deaminase RidA [Mycobacterium shimoidei]ORW77789.1 enamine deaminase RidA [Mycobacterium shimoidei]SRX96233.1 endoribonuclease L-PSP [Conexibacter woesei DSM] [Mycobacterium shimoidei]
MTTINRIFTGVGAHIAPGYADAVAVSGSGTQIFVSGTPGLREDGTVPDDFADEARQCWANVETALDKAGATLTDIVYMRQWLTSRDNVSDYLAVSKAIIQHEPAAMLSIIDGLVWPNQRVEVEVIAVLPS